MKWCRSCVLPDTRPNLTIGADGICSACGAFEQRDVIDWQKRQAEFEALADGVRRLNRDYDCLVPVSGGKDSTWQVVKCLEFGLRPLTVSWRPPARTEIGRRNLDNLIRLGVDHIDFSIKPSVEAAFMRSAFERAGSSGIPMHFAIFAIPVNIAVKLEIPLIVWGENSAIEYGGGEDDRNLTHLSDDWLLRYGVTQGTRIDEWYDSNLTERELRPYTRPDADVLEERNIQAVFLGHYFQWDPHTSLSVATAHGFKASEEGPKTGYYAFADIDDDFISVHHWLKWHKFGFTRLFDNLSLEIRHGRISRASALQIIREEGAKPPKADISSFCKFTGLLPEEFDAVCESYRNLDIWRRVDGTWLIEDFLISDWNWE